MTYHSRRWLSRHWVDLGLVFCVSALAMSITDIFNCVKLNGTLTHKTCILRQANEDYSDCLSCSQGRAIAAKFADPRSVKSSPKSQRATTQHRRRKRPGESAYSFHHTAGQGDRRKESLTVPGDRPLGLSAAERLILSRLESTGADIIIARGLSEYAAKAKRAAA